ncbi:MAG: hypothetical protein LBL67_02940 [Coriobacteriales bacterium]|jgi:hypothetical protein|nr:hypothetical protein [Coriobacteriales bacterium]
MKKSDPRPEAASTSLPQTSHKAAPQEPTGLKAARKHYLKQTALWMVVVTAGLLILEQAVYAVCVTMAKAPLANSVGTDLLVALAYLVWPLLLVLNLPRKRRTPGWLFAGVLLVVLFLLVALVSFRFWVYQPTYNTDLLIYGNEDNFPLYALVVLGIVNWLCNILDALLKIVVVLALIRAFGWRLPDHLVKRCLKALLGVIIVFAAGYLLSQGIYWGLSLLSNFTSQLATMFSDVVIAPAQIGAMVWVFLWAFSKPGDKLSTKRLQRAVKHLFSRGSLPVSQG